MTICASDKFAPHKIAPGRRAPLRIAPDRSACDRFAPEGFFSKAARSVLRHIRVNSKHELKQWVFSK
jgi:hypothetical protein